MLVISKAITCLIVPSLCLDVSTETRIQVHEKNQESVTRND
jgi:hypothetical protein